MVANLVLTVERTFDYPRDVVFDAWTVPAEMAQWRGSPGVHVEPETVTSELKLGGRHHHVKVDDADPTNRVVTDAVFTEWFRPDVFVAKQRITGDPGIDPNTTLELRVEFIKTGKNGTMLRIIQGPYDPAVAQFHAEGWEKELQRLQGFLDSTKTKAVAS